MMLMIIVCISLWFCIHYPIAGGRVQEDSYSAASFNRRCNPEEAQGRTSSWMGMVPSRLISTGTQWSLRLESSIPLSPFFAPQINYTCSGLRCWAHWRGRWCGAQTVAAFPCQGWEIWRAILWFMISGAPLSDIFFWVHTILHNILGFDTIITQYLPYFRFGKNARKLQEMRH